MTKRVVGIDPGTKSFDVFGLMDDEVLIDVSIPSNVVAEDPNALLDTIKGIEPLDVIVGPSGYGLPFKHISQLDDDDFFLLTLVRPDDEKIPVLIGLNKVVKEMKKAGMNVYFIPGVIHLPTVPPHRKINAIDMGTADKMCCAVLAVFDYSVRHDEPFDKASLLLVEVGYGYNAVIAIDGGRIVDGIGGTRAGPGFLTGGAFDGEVAYLMGKFGKEVLFRGGVRSIAGYDITPEELSSAAGSNERVKLAWNAFVEGIEKSVRSLLTVVKEPRCIMLSGRLARIDSVYSELRRRLSDIAPVEKIIGFNARAKEAAQGAALIANGIAGGFAKGLIEHMRIREASGTVLDYVFLEDLKKRYLGTHGNVRSSSRGS